MPLPTASSIDVHESGIVGSSRGQIVASLPGRHPKLGSSMSPLDALVFAAWLRHTASMELQMANDDIAENDVADLFEALIEKVQTP